MKKAFLILAGLLAMSGTLRAQVKFGIEGGMNATGFSSTTTSGRGLGIGYQGGLTFDYEFKNHLVLGTGLTWIHRQSSVRLRGRDGWARSPKAQIVRDQLMLPLHLGYKFSLNEKLRLTPYLGGYAALSGRGGSGMIDIQGGENGVTHTQWIPQDGYFATYKWIDEEGNSSERTEKIEGVEHPFTYGALVGVTLESQKHYTVSLQYTHSLNNIQTSNKLHEKGWMLSVGYKF